MLGTYAADFDQQFSCTRSGKIDLLFRKKNQLTKWDIFFARLHIHSLSPSFSQGRRAAGRGEGAPRQRRQGREGREQHSRNIRNRRQRNLGRRHREDPREEGRDGEGQAEQGRGGGQEVGKVKQVQRGAHPRLSLLATLPGHWSQYLVTDGSCGVFNVH